MAFSAFSKIWVLVSVVIFISLSSCKFGTAIEYPNLGAADVFARGYLPEADAERRGDQYFPEAGLIGTKPALLNKALDCFNDKHIYSSCNEDYRLTQSGELNVLPKYTDQYCNGPCALETQHVLDCVDQIAKDFLFFNRATLNNVRDAINGGCSYGPKRGNFNVVEPIGVYEGSVSSGSKRAGVAYGFVFVTVACHVFF